MLNSKVWALLGAIWEFGPLRVCLVGQNNKHIFRRHPAAALGLFPLSQRGKNIPTTV